MNDGMWNSPATEKRIEEYEADALADLKDLSLIWQNLTIVLNRMRVRDVTLCDGGNLVDLMGLAEQFRPHSVAEVGRHAREVAADREAV